MRTQQQFFGGSLDSLEQVLWRRHRAGVKGTRLPPGMVFLSSYSAVAKLTYLVWDSVLLGTLSWKVRVKLRCSCCAAAAVLWSSALVFAGGGHGGECAIKRRGTVRMLDGAAVGSRACACLPRIFTVMAGDPPSSRAGNEVWRAGG